MTACKPGGHFFYILLACFNKKYFTCAAICSNFRKAINYFPKPITSAFMKIISTLLSLLIVFSFSASSQQWRLTGGYSLGLPQQEMGQNIPATHGLQAGVMYRLPGALKQLSAGLELGFGMYANKRIDQTFTFDNNTSTVVPVNYSSNVFNAALQTRLNLLPAKSLAIPYVSAKGGMYNFFSTIYIDDPHDPGGCRALEQENIINDKTVYWSAGGGVQVNPAIFVSKNKRKGKDIVLLDIGANLLRGGTINYINAKNLMDAPSTIDPEGKPLNVRFINASTQEIHEHKVAQVYTSPLRMLEFRAGITVLLD